MSREKTRAYVIGDLPSWLSPSAPPEAPARLVRPLYRPEDDIVEKPPRKNHEKGTAALIEYNRKRAEAAFAADGLTVEEREKERLRQKSKRDRRKYPRRKSE